MPQHESGDDQASSFDEEMAKGTRPDTDRIEESEQANSTPSLADGHPDIDDFGFKQASEKAKRFPQTPGVYLMKDLAGI